MLTMWRRSSWSKSTQSVSGRTTSKKTAASEQPQRNTSRSPRLRTRCPVQPHHGFSSFTKRTAGQGPANGRAGTVEVRRPRCRQLQFHAGGKIHRSVVYGCPLLLLLPPPLRHQQWRPRAIITSARLREKLLPSRQSAAG